MKEIPTFLEFVEAWLRLSYDEYRKECEHDEDDVYYEEVLRVLIKCEACEEYKEKNKDLFNDINAWLNKCFTDDSVIEIKNQVFRHVNNLIDKYNEIMFDESYGI